MNGITFDAGGLIANRKDHRVLVRISTRQGSGMRITIPTTALAQAIGNPARHVLVSKLIRQAGTELVALDGPVTTAVGLVLANTGTADIVDSHVVVYARRSRQPVLTTDPGDLRRIAPELNLAIA